MNAARRRLLLASTVAAMALVLLDRLRDDDAGPRRAAPELSEIVVPPVRAAVPPPEPAGLDLWRIADRNTGAPTAGDAFAARSWVRPPPPAPPPTVVEAPMPPPAPQAPPLPFKYLGRLELSAEHTAWYLGQGERLLVVAAGETIDGAYRVDGFDNGQLRLTYLPLGIQQALPIGAPP